MMAVPARLFHHERHSLIPTTIAKKLQRTIKTDVILPVASPRVGAGLRQVALALEVMEGRLISPPYLPIRQFDLSARHVQVFYRNALSYE